MLEGKLGPKFKKRSDLEIRGEIQNSRKVEKWKFEVTCRFQEKVWIGNLRFLVME